MRQCNFQGIRFPARALFHFAMIALWVGCGSPSKPDAKKVDPAGVQADRAASAKAAKALSPPKAEANGPDSKSSADTSSATKKNGLTDAQLAKLVVVAGKMACARKTLEDAKALDKAESTILVEAGLKRTVFSKHMEQAANNAMFQASVRQAVTLCTKAANRRAVELRGKLKALAVASQCLAKQGKSGEAMNDIMMAQYKAYGLTMSEYAREMSKLANDRPFQDEIRAAVNACPQAEPITADAVTATDTRTAATEDGGPALVGANTPEISDDDALNGAPASSDTLPVRIPVDTEPRKPEVIAPAPSTPEVIGPAETKPQKTTPSRPRTWTGTFGSGSQRGRVTIRARGAKISATIVIGSSRLSLTGRLSGNQVRFSGRRAQMFAKFHGTLSGGKMTGRVIATMKIGGRLTSIRSRWSARRK